MIYEQISTSLPKCLDGNAGFGIAAQTSGMPQNISQMLHSLSGYTHRFPAGSPQNPIVFLHCICGGYHILSRIADCGNDYSGRTNRIAHHLVIADVDARTMLFGPTDVLQRYSFAGSWNQAPQSLTPIPNLPNIRTEAKVCASWEKVGIGNAGWAGVLAERVEAGQTVNLVFNPALNMLPRLGEAFSLLPAAVRWRIPFSTYFMKTQETADSPLRVRCILSGSEEEAYTKMPNVWNLDLRQRIPGVPQGKYVELAKTGQVAKTVAIPLAVPAPSVPLPDAAPNLTPFALQTEQTAVPLKGRKVLKRGEWKDSMEPQTNWNTVILCLIALVLIVLIVGSVLIVSHQQTNTEKIQSNLQNVHEELGEIKKQYKEGQTSVEEKMRHESEKNTEALEKIADTQKQTEECVEKINKTIAEMQQRLDFLEEDKRKFDEFHLAMYQQIYPKQVAKFVAEKIPDYWAELNKSLSATDELLFCKNKIQLVYVPFADLTDITPLENASGEMSFSYKKKVTKKENGKDVETETIEPLAEIKWDKGLQFNWQSKNEDARRERILLSTLTLKYGGDVLKTIVLYLPQEKFILPKCLGEKDRFFVAITKMNSEKVQVSEKYELKERMYSPKLTLTYDAKDKKKTDEGFCAFSENGEVICHSVQWKKPKDDKDADTIKHNENVDKLWQEVKPVAYQVYLLKSSIDYETQREDLEKPANRLLLFETK
jgi:hypothetical protein